MSGLSTFFDKLKRAPGASALTAMSIPIVAVGIADAGKALLTSPPDWAAVMKAEKVEIKDIKLPKGVEPITTKREVNAFMKRYGHEYGAEDRVLAKIDMKQVLDDRINGMAGFTPKSRKPFVVVPKKVTKVILEHELGHIKSKHYSLPGPLSLVSRRAFTKQVMDIEREAWSKVKKSKDKTAVEPEALKSYDLSFHRNRAKGALALGGAGLLFGLIRLKKRGAL